MDQRKTDIVPASISSQLRQATKRRRRARRQVDPVGVPALLPELVIEHQAGGGARLRVIHWPSRLAAPVAEVSSAPEALADMVAGLHRKLGSYLRLTVHRADGLVSTEILPPPFVAAEESGHGAPGTCLVSGFEAGEEAWIAQVVSVDAASDSGVVDAGTPDRLTLVIAPSSGRIVLVDPADDGPPARLTLRGTGGGQ